MRSALARARRRGVDVRVIMPLVGNHGPVNRSNVLAVNAMLEHGIRVYLYPGMSHIKAAVFDGWACLGSGPNIDPVVIWWLVQDELGNYWEVTCAPCQVVALTLHVAELKEEKCVLMRRAANSADALRHALWDAA